MWKRYFGRESSYLKNATCLHNMLYYHGLKITSILSCPLDKQLKFCLSQKVTYCTYQSLLFCFKIII